MSDPLRVLMSGPLSMFAAGFREELLGRGWLGLVASPPTSSLAEISTA